MKMILTIPGRLPGLNEYIKAMNSNRHTGNAMKQVETTRVEWLARSQLRGVVFTSPVRLRFFWYEKNKKRDQDNISGFGHKVIQDGLVKAGVLKNDGWKGVMGHSDEYFVDKENPRIVVEITDERKEDWMEPKGVVAASQPRWIPVTERLPEEFVSVLVFMPEEHPLPTVREGYLSPCGFMVFGLYQHVPDVTHWMPLPEPPKKDNPKLIGGVGE